MKTKMEYKRLGDIATYINGYAFKPEQWGINGLPIIRIQNLTNSDSQMNYFNDEIDEKYIVKQGDVLIAWSASLGVYEWQREEALLNQHIFKVVFDKIEVDKTYFKFMVSQALNLATKYLHGSTMKHITKRYFDEIEIPFPAFSVQNQIGEILEKASNLQIKRQSQITALDELTQSLFLEIFGDPISNSKHWEFRTLKDLGEWKSGGTPLKSKKEYYGGNIPWLSSGELNDIYVSKSLEYITDKAVKESSTKYIKEGSILLGMYDTAALKSSIVKMNCTCNQAIAFSKLNNTVSTIYIYKYIQMAKEHLKRQQRGVRQKNMNLSMIKNLIVMYPPLDIQLQFEEKFLIIEEKKQLMIEGLNKLKVLYESLLQKAFKGQLFQEQ